MCRTQSLLLVLATMVGLCGTALSADQGKAVRLFDGTSLAGWGYYLVEPDVKMEDVWSVQDGILVCRGEPMGYLCTKEEYTDFRLVVQWRWAPGKKPGNSGVLLRITGEPRALPKCYEAQLKHEDAGDIYGFQGMKLTGAPDRLISVPGHKLAGNLTGVKKARGAEKPPGEWNEYQITLSGGHLTLVINDHQVNEATDLDVMAGKIAVQSEGGEIQFRTIELFPIGD